MNNFLELPSTDLKQFWGKAGKSDTDCPSWHPLVFHSLDVIAVAEELLTVRNGYLKVRFCELLGSNLDTVHRIVLYFVGLHDIGKFARKFQLKSRSHYPREVLGDYPIGAATDFDHASGGFRIVCHHPCSSLRSDRRTLARSRILVAATTGHHGSPPLDSHIGRNRASLESDFGSQGIQAAIEFMDWLANLTEFRPKELSQLEIRNCKVASFFLAGFVSLCDWIGSNRERWFCYEHPDSYSTTGYLESAREKAKRAVRDAGVVPGWPAPNPSYQSIMGSTDGIEPTPMQKWAMSCSVPSGPMLVIIEDETGSGKTESALKLASRQINEGLGCGLHIALPTMATTNAMFERLNQASQVLFDATKGRPSLVLAHSGRTLYDGFQKLTQSSSRDDAYSESHISPTDNTRDSDITASAYCSEWLGDNQKKSFLADLGAGTIDQSLLAILPSRYQSLRLLGISTRLLIVDEVHAYDAYMQRELQELVRFQSALGGSTILLSATLPDFVKKTLIKKFQLGLGSTPSHDVQLRSDYPLVTVVSRSGVVDQAVSGRQNHARTVPVTYTDCKKQVYDTLVENLNTGMAVLYLRNTVADALETRDELEKRGIKPLLFHSRFTLRDRQRIEAEVMQRWGKRSQPESRKGILIATQIVEQSLDLDFDSIVTDLAPIDSLIQRCGRLWRHYRRERPGSMKLVVYGPSLEGNTTSDWYSNFFRRASYVYKDHAKLWLTAKILTDVGEIVSPMGVRQLISTVYSDRSFDLLPTSLQEKWIKFEGEQRARQSVADFNVLKLNEGYSREGQSWRTEEKIPTRLADDIQVPVRLGIVQKGEIRPLSIEKGESFRDAWRMNEVKVSQRTIENTVQDEFGREIHAAKNSSNWGKYSEHVALLVLQPTGIGVWMADITKSGSDQRVRYDSRVGLVFL